jgi:hypothetical protein
VRKPALSFAFEASVRYLSSFRRRQQAAALKTHEPFMSLKNAGTIESFRVSWPEAATSLFRCCLVLAVISVSALECRVFPVEVTTGAQAVSLPVPIIKQPYKFCLVASVSMVLKYWGVEITPDAIGQKIPVYKDGTTGRDLAEFVEAIGLRGFLIQPSFEDLLGHLEKGRPLIVTLPEGGSLRHAMVLVGFDPSTDIVWLNDPSSGSRKSQTYTSFRKRWEDGQRWTFLIIPK